MSLAITEVEQSLNDYKFDVASQTAYDFFWNELCSHISSWQKEYSMVNGVVFARSQVNSSLLVILAVSTLRLLHPMIPFVTEELLQSSREIYQGDDKDHSDDPLIQECLLALQSSFCATSSFPDIQKSNPQAEITFNFFSQVLQKIRNLRAEMGVPPQVATEVTFLCTDTSVHATLEPLFPLLHSLLPIRKLECTHEITHSDLSSSAFINDLQILIPLPEELKEKERARLIKEKEKSIEQINGLLKKLENPEFIEKAPPQLVAKTKEQMQQLENKLKEIDDKD